jgi:acetaldehyde dehydrogenase (acetylating)
MNKVKVGIIGTGNIGTDLLIKVQRSDVLECGIFAGKNPDSTGIKKAKAMGVKTSFNSIKAIQDDSDCCQIVFDATSAKVHTANAPILKQLGKFVVDLTPSQIGKMCVPVINLAECLNCDNINLVTCGGQAVIPIVYAIMKVHPETEYIEVIASIASKSAGIGTRVNIDEYTQATKDAIITFTGVPKAKAIIVLNPAEPPILMHNTIYAKIEKPRIEEIAEQVISMVKKIQKYVPGYKVILGPVVENNRVTTMVEVVGLGDFLPKYSGNLDIMTCAAVNVAEEFARKKILKIRH